jgi:DNA-directed RNA polymerase subunit RPC12/RpoP
MKNEEIPIKSDSSNNGYRMVTKKYFCYTCDKQKKKLISVQDFEEWGLQCDECGEGFCEILDQDNKDLVQELKNSGKITVVEEA